ncbi:uncharacterized protein [Euwallacea fornicatus]|uniref:uncharacterized protein isoform X1 n=1 Tax=Euwallacea fornicatus TaxID=995702 RepID=UPI00338F5AB5
MTNNNHKVLIFVLSLNFCYNTIDLNAAELQYLADHLTPEECRKLVAAAHFQGFDQPNALDQAERKIPKDIPCLEHLHHWNSQTGEGKGETHEILEHRLRQIGKSELADWLGKAVFHELGSELQKAIQEGLINFVTTENSSEVPVITLEPLEPKIENPSNYNIMDYFLYCLAAGIGLTILGLLLKLILNKLRQKLKQRKRRTPEEHELLETYSSGSEFEDNKFDMRTFTSSTKMTT